jgi:hypothetical protein
MYPWRTFAELDCLGLSIVARQIGQRIRVPEIAADETEAHYRRSLQETLNRFRNAEKDLTDDFNLEYVHVEPDPRPDDLVTEWRRRLRMLAEEVPHHSDDAVEALRREIHGRPPARRAPKKPGIGARDVAVWLAILRDHVSRDEVGHLLSKDFGAFGKDGDLKAELREDLSGAGTNHPIHLYPGIDEFLSLLGEPSDVEIDLADLERRAAPMLRKALEVSSEVPLAVYEDLVGHERRYRTLVKEARPVRVLSARRYEREDDAVTVVNAEWELRVDTLMQSRDTPNQAEWYVQEDVPLNGAVQLYLADERGEELPPQFISARFRSEESVQVTVSDAGEFRVMSLRQAPLF